MNRTIIVTTLTTAVIFGLVCISIDSHPSAESNVGLVANHGFFFPATGIMAEGQAVLFALDEVSLPLRRNIVYFPMEPKVRAEPVLTPSRDNPNAPDYLATHFYGTVLYENNKFRMWYYPCHLGHNPDWPPELKKQTSRWKGNIIVGPLAYAESTDGLQWEKPNLGQLLFKGDRNNNAFDLPSALTAAPCVIKDDSDPDPSRLYKMAFWTQYDPFDYPSMRVAVSPDGLHWTTAPKPPIQEKLELCSLYQYNGLYIVNSQIFPSDGLGRRRGRTGAAWLSTDFDRWLQESVESFALPYAEGPQRDEVHLGVAPVSFGNVLVGLYCIWHNSKNFGDISGDLGLVVSNDGLAFREPMKGYRWLKSEESPATPVPGKNYKTILCQSNGILNIGEETRIYHGRWRNVGFGTPDVIEKDYYAEVALATLPRDRWAALGLVEDQQVGSIWSTPIKLPDTDWTLVLNADGISGIQIELCDSEFQLLSNFSGENCGTPVGEDGLDCSVAWKGHSLKELAGQTIRLHVRLKRSEKVNPRLFAIYLRSAPK